MTPGRTARRVAGFIVHNWPLKVAAIVLATLLYAGLVASQDSSVYPGPIPVVAVNAPAGTTVINQLRVLDQIRYIAPAGVGRLRADDFRATVDLAGMKPTGAPISVRVSVTVADPRVTILDIQPRSIQVELDEVSSLSVPVNVVQGPPAVGIQVGETVYTPKNVTITGPSTAVKRVVAVRVNVALDPNGINFDRDVQADPVDAANEVVTGVNVDPRTVHVTVPQFRNKQSRTVPVNPVLTGSPGPGFRISAVEATPLVVSVEGSSDQLATLPEADTAPIAVFGATRDVTVTVVLSLPPGVVPVKSDTVTVVVRIVPVTETRTFAAGFRLDGRAPGFDYALADNTVLLTLYGSTADLDRLAAAPLVVGLNVAGLTAGTHNLPVVPSLPSGVTVAALTPATITVTIVSTASPSPPAASASPGTPPGSPPASPVP